MRGEYGPVCGELLQEHPADGRIHDDAAVEHEERREGDAQDAVDL